MAPPIKIVRRVVVVLVFILWLLQLFVGDVPLPSLLIGTGRTCRVTLSIDPLPEQPEQQLAHRDAFFAASRLGLLARAWAGCR
jgi:hypothetical protein